MKIENIKIEDIKPYSKNAKKHSDKLKICKYCNKGYKRNIRYSNKQWEKSLYCSNNCRGKDNTILLKKEKIPCKNCGVSIVDYVSNFKNKQFCSIKCKSEFSRVVRVCKNCGKSFSICKSVLKTNATGNYCSRDCYIKYITTGITKNKNGFRQISEKIRKTTQFCAICGNIGKIHIHHIEPFKYTQNNNLENLIPLCRSHHKIVEWQTEKLLGVFGDNKDIVWFMIKNILRSRQLETYSFIKGIK
jgi:hypothetical protein